MSLPPHYTAFRYVLVVVLVCVVVAIAALLADPVVRDGLARFLAVGS